MRDPVNNQIYLNDIVPSNSHVKADPPTVASGQQWISRHDFQTYSVVSIDLPNIKLVSHSEYKVVIETETSLLTEYAKLNTVAQKPYVICPTTGKKLCPHTLEELDSVVDFSIRKIL